VTKNNQTLLEKTDETSKFDEEMAELKKDMKSAKLADWLQSHQQMLMVGVVLLLIAMFAGGLWSEQQKTKKEAAAMMYYQGISLQDKEKQKVLLEKVKRDYANTAYATLARMRLASFVNTEKNLREIMADKTLNPELRWQAGLDLAEYLIQNDKKDAAKQVLKEHVGREYEQLRYALLASLSEGEAKKVALQKSMAAPSHDDVLKSQVTSELAQLN